MSYKHGIYTSEVPTSLIPPVTVNSALPIFLVTAPVNLAKDPYNVTNEPKLCYSYQEAVEHFGFSMKSEIWDNYTVCQAIYSQFALYGVAPMVIVNVLDPKEHKEDIETNVTFDRFTHILEIDGVLIDSVKIKKDEISYYEAGEDYTLSFNNDGYVVISIYANSGITENSELNIELAKLRPDLVDEYDIIGGYNNVTGKNEGLELVNEIYSRFRLVPGQLVAPKYSSNPSVAAVMETKASNINGHFKCIALNDIPTKNGDEYLRYTDVPMWKNQNNYISNRQINCYPMLQLGEQFFYYSTQLAGLIAWIDSKNDGIPYESPSNKNLKMNGLIYEDGTPLILQNEQANYLNGEGIVTAINFSNGFTAWGNRTGVYPSNTDVKDSFIPVRRMFDWIANTIVLTFWNKIDYPLTKRNIYSIVDSINIWLNGLTSREYILGGKVEFVQEDNPTNDLIDGTVRFKVMITPPTPMREIEFILEYDPGYLQTLFG